jgi:hypothetical protein
MSRYEHPINDEGHSVKAAHGFDEFAIRLRGQPIDNGYPNLKEIDPVPVNPPDPVAIPDGPPDVRQAIRDFMGRIEVRAEDGLVLRGPFQAGDPIPILAMKSAAIDRERAQPERLFQPQSSAMMVPVFKDGILVDSFLLLNRHGGWVEDGYSNNEIARLMVNLRNNRKSPERPEAGFYLVSIPEEGSFFAGHGFRNRANLISLDNGAMGDFIPARQALEALHKQIDRRKSGTRGEVRPR